MLRSHGHIRSFPKTGFSNVVSPAVQAAIENGWMDGAEARRRACAEGLSLIDGTFPGYVRSKIRHIYSDPDIRQLMSELVTSELNPGGDAANSVPSVYTHGARRYLRETSDAQEAAWVELLDEGDISTQQSQFQRLPYVSGQPLVVIPYLDDLGKLQRQEVTADRYDAAIGLDGQPRAVIWKLPDDDQRIIDAHAPYWCAVDDYAWYYFDVHGRQAENYEGFHEIPHGCVDEMGRPMCPAAVSRLNRQRPGESWYTPTFNRRLFDATITVGVTYARLRFRRKVQDGKLGVIKAKNKADIPAAQTMGDPERPAIFVGAGGLSVSFEMVDMVTDPAEFITMIRFAYEALFGAEGIPSSDVTVRIGDAPKAAVNVRKERRAALKRAQMPFAYNFERRLALSTSSLVTASDHPSAGRIPGPSRILDRWGIEFGTPTVDSPKEQRDQDDWERKNGLISMVDIVMRKYPWIQTRKAALDHLMRNADEDNSVNEILADRNQPLGAPINQNNAEQNGALGPAVRDGQLALDSASNDDQAPDGVGAS